MKFIKVIEKNEHPLILHTGYDLRANLDLDALIISETTFIKVELGPSKVFARISIGYI